MKEILDYLKANPAQHLATVGLDGKAKCRPFQFMTEFNGKLWFCTSNQKSVYKELQANPSFELSVTAPDFSWCRISGDAHFENNMEVKEFVIANDQLVASIYKTADNPIFEVFYIANGEAIIADFSGDPPTTFKL